MRSKKRLVVSFRFTTISYTSCTVVQRTVAEQNQSSVSGLRVLSQRNTTIQQNMTNVRRRFRPSGLRNLFTNADQQNTSCRQADDRNNDKDTSVMISVDPCLKKKKKKTNSGRCVPRRVLKISAHDVSISSLQLL